MINLIEMAATFVEKGYTVTLTPVPKCGAGEQYLTVTKDGDGYTLSQFTILDTKEGNYSTCPEIVSKKVGKKKTYPKATLVQLELMKEIGAVLDLPWKQIFYRNN